MEIGHPAWLSARWHGWTEAERGRFVPWLSVAMGAGVIVYFALGAEPHLASGIVAFAVALLLCVAGWRMSFGRATAVVALAMAAGFLSAQTATWRALPIEVLPTKAVVLTGTIQGVDLLPEGRRVSLAGVRLGPDQPVLERTIRVRLHRADAAPMAVGDRVQIRALIRPPSPPTHPGAWDLQRDAFFSGLGGSGYALNPSEVLERAPPQGMRAVLRSTRDVIERRFSAGLAGATGAVAGSLLVGSAGAIPVVDREAFRDSGLSHLLSVSGLHMAVVVGFVMSAVRLLLAIPERTALHWPTKAIAAGTALLAGGFYMLLTGASLPIMRCFAMAALVTLGIALGRRALSMRGLAVAAVALMLVSPHEVLGVSFAMSFAAVLALIAGFEALRPMLTWLQQAGAWGQAAGIVAGLVLTSLLAGTAAAPFGAYHFGQVQAYYVIANLAGVPLTSFWIMPWGLVALALMPLGLEWLALAPMGWGIDGLLWIGRTVAGWPAAKLTVPHMTAWGIGLFAFGLAWTGLWRSRIRWAGITAMVAGLLSPLTAPAPDILVSSEARLIAIRDGGFFVQARSGASKFTRSAWQNYLAAGPLMPLQTGQPESCGPNACRIDRGGMRVLLLRGNSAADGCAGVGLVVSSEPARDECPGVPYVDRFSVWRNGAHAVWLTDSGPSILSDRAFRGDRPWVPGLPVPRRSVPNLPMAATDDLPPALED